MYRIVVFLMLLSCCTARSTYDGREVMDATPTEGDTEVNEKIIEENSALVELDATVEGGPTESGNLRKLFTFTTTAAPRPFTQTLDLTLVLNAANIQSRKSGRLLSSVPEK